MANKSLHKGWLYARDNLKFSPYILAESIVNRNGTTWANVVDGKVADLETAVGVIHNTYLPNLQNEVNAVEDRAIILEQRTQYLNAEDSDAFYITDGSGWVCFKVNGIGASSTNFTTPVTDLNSLKQTTDDIGAAVAQLQNVSVSELRGLITELQERTKYMDASNPDNAFYFTDGYGNVIARIDSNGITSINFTSEGVTDLNSLNEAVNGLRQADLDFSGLLGILTAKLDNDLSPRVQNLESRTKYLDASTETGIFAVTDKDGNIGMQVDNNGVLSTDFIIQMNAANQLSIKEKIAVLDQKDADLGGQITNINTTLDNKIDKTKSDLQNEIKTTKENLEKSISDTDTSIRADMAGLATELRTKDSEFANAIGDLTPRMVAVETRTQYINAIDNNGVFQVVDGEGNVGMQVDGNGVTANKFIIQTKGNVNAQIPVIGYQITGQIEI